MTDNNELTASIVAAFVSRNTVAVDALPGLISSTYAAICDLGTSKPEPVPAPEPAVSIKASVKPDAITCLCCGTKGKMLKRHLLAAHGLTPEEYRAKWDLPTSYPMTAPNYAARRAELAKEIGLGRKPGAKASRVKKAA